MMSMKLHMRQLMGSLLPLLFLTAGLAAGQPDGERFSALLNNVRVNGVELHYLESGSGISVVLIHGGLGDYREWNLQIGRISSHYRVIAYSRRYNYPNNNVEILPDHSAIVEARDLAALLDALKLERVHIVGYSYGALTALFFATEHPERVRSLTMAEPPILGWLSEIPGGQTELNKFMQTMWRPAGEAFRRDDPEAALRITCDYFSGIGSYDQVPTGFKQSLMDNIREMEGSHHLARCVPAAEPRGGEGPQASDIAAHWREHFSPAANDQRRNETVTTECGKGHHRRRDS
jgi:pimeloyl-ACP methyl ester carboxylesterase